MSNPRLTRIDWPTNAYPANASPSAASADTGIGEAVVITSTGSYPVGATINFAATAQPIAYNVQGSRAVVVQLDTANVTGSGTFQIQVSESGVGFAPVPIRLTPDSAAITSIPIPTGGSTGTPNATIIVLDAPWFSYLRVVVNVASSAGTARLTIGQRD